MTRRIWTREDEKREVHVRRNLQKAETALDSLTQKLVRSLGEDHEYFKKARIAFNAIRQLQFSYPKNYKVVDHSLLRYSDGSIKPDGTRNRRMSKGSWRKFKKIRDRKKLQKLESFA